MTFPPRLVPWLPKSVLALRGYTPDTFRQDLLAGATTGLVALPLAMAFAIASGLTPQAGLYCAVVTGFLISALGGSLVQIGGPTGAFVVVVAGIVAKYGVDGLYTCTMMAGVMLVLLGATRSGSAVRFIPRPVVIGFTNGIAVIIASTQIRDFLGLRIGGTPGDFLGRMRVIVGHLNTATPAAVTVAVVTLALVVVFNRFVKAVPGTIAGMVGGTLLGWLSGWHLETVGSRFGGVPSGLPPFQLPAFHPSVALTLLAPAVTIALLGAIESLMSAVVSDRMTGDRHNPNVELIAQGVANFVTPMLGGLPATGAIARTATNVRSGARTPVAGMVHALTLLAILLVGAKLAAAIPMAVLAGLLFVVAARMGEWHEIPLLLRQTKTDVAVWLATFALTVFADLTVAVEVGMVLAALLYIRRVSSTTTVTRVTAAYLEEGREHVLQDQVIPDYVAIVRIHGPFLFGATDKLDALVETLDPRAEIVIVRLRNMTAIDATGVRALEDVVARLGATRRTAIFCGAREQPSAVLRQTGFAATAGELNICPNIRTALVRARQIHETATHAARPIAG
ncbi:MAG TPA: SulP family inorganic anion transporter [Vicinamibacterales bacterium]|nr:SulP family inorganic anion transporter [Vicinamibacterales bacterium]